MQIKFCEDKITYDGSALSPLYAYKTYGILGESCIAWIGPCKVSNEHMKDGEDLFAGETIASDEMLHFIIEIFEQPLFPMVLLQRLMAAQIKDALQDLGVLNLKRDGDDIYQKNKKLSISIASKSSVSSMIHFALNTTNTGTPVETCCLNDFNINPRDFAEMVLTNFKREFESVVVATKKVYSL